MRNFLQCERGNFAVGLACLLPLFLGGIGGAIDLLVYANHRSELQATADAAVMAAASEAGLKNWSEQAATQIAGAVIDSNLSGKFSGVSFDFDVTASVRDRTVDLTLTQDHYGYFFLGYFTGSPQIAVRSGAIASGQATLCIVVQSESQAEAFKMSGDSRIKASGCSAYSNSVNPKGITVKDSSRLTTQLACSAGGYTGGLFNFSPRPLTDCPILKDPLAARATLVDETAAAQGTCDHKKKRIEKSKVPLTAGVYCGGLEITEKSQVILSPGIYYMLNGKLKVDKASTISGNGVAFVFVGEKSVLELKNDTTVSLSAPENGAMAGILVYSQPVPGKVRDFKIESRDAQKLIGTVYLPGDKLVIGGDKDGDGVCDLAPGELVGELLGLCKSDVGAGSSWTAIVAKFLNITNGATLVLNSDYAASTVPVPQGLGPTSGQISLAK